MAVLAGAGAGMLARPRLAVLIGVAVVLRLAAANFHFFVAPLPDGVADAARFESLAWELASAPGGILANFTESASYYYSVAAAYIYAATGRSALMLQGLSVAAGTLCVYFTWRLACELWGRATAMPAAWIVALMPTLVMYSALTLREVFFATFLVWAMIHVVLWARGGSGWHATMAAIGLMAGSLFHTGMVAALAVLVALVAGHSLYRLLADLLHRQLHFRAMALLVAGLGLGVALVVIDPAIPKFGTVSSLLSADRYLGILESRVSGTGAYPDWMVPASSFDLWWIVPMRSVYLLLSPFLWGVSEFSHALGYVDALVYAGLGLAVLLNWPRIARNPAALAVLLILMALIVAFGVGTGNFGTALRHRAKLLPLIAVLAAPTITWLATMRAPGRETPAE